MILVGNGHSGGAPRATGNDSNKIGLASERHLLPSLKFIGDRPSLCDTLVVIVGTKPLKDSLNWEAHPRISRNPLRRSLH